MTRERERRLNLFFLKWRQQIDNMMAENDHDLVGHAHGSESVRTGCLGSRWSSVQMMVRVMPVTEIIHEVLKRRRRPRVFFSSSSSFLFSKRYVMAPSPRSMMVLWLTCTNKKKYIEGRGKKKWTRPNSLGRNRNHPNSLISIIKQEKILYL